jgi:large subunit ribosomal protein L18
MRKSYEKVKQPARKRLLRRKLNIRSKIEGSPECPRLSVYKSNKHISVQVIDDTVSTTLFSMHTFGKKAVAGASCTVEGAKVMGEKVAGELKGRKIEQVVFDRNGLRYTGILASLADSIRKNGINV